MSGFARSLDLRPRALHISLDSFLQSTCRYHPLPSTLPAASAYPQLTDAIHSRGVANRIYQTLATRVAHRCDRCVVFLLLLVSVFNVASCVCSAFAFTLFTQRQLRLFRFRVRTGLFAATVLCITHTRNDKKQCIRKTARVIARIDIPKWCGALQ